MPVLAPLGFAFYVIVLLAAFAVRSAAGLGAGLAVLLLVAILPVSTALSLATALTTLTAQRRYSRHPLTASYTLLEEAAAVPGAIPGTRPELPS